MEINKIKVSIVMISFNHEKYIIEAIEGVLNQQCNFEIELILANDNSPDNTNEVVNNFLANHPKKKYVKYTCHEQNKGMMGNFIWALNQCQGKYIALCEGDDYWTDPLKLQKQVSFLEANADYGLVHTNTKILNQRTKKFIDRVLGKEAGDELESKELFYEILNGKYVIFTPTALFRRKLFSSDIINSNYAVGDIPIWLHLSQVSKIKFFEDITAISRATEGSMTRQTGFEKKLSFTVSMAELCLELLGKYQFPIDEGTVNKYRNRIFDFKSYYINALDVKHPEFFNSDEKLFLRKDVSKLTYFYKKLKYYSNNYKVLFLMFYSFLKNLNHRS